MLRKEDCTMVALTEPLQLGVVLPTWDYGDGVAPGWAELRDLAQQAEAVGVDTVWAPDHFSPALSDGRTQNFWESWTILAAVAGATQRVTLGPFIASAPLRQPALLARMATTLDAVSSGRVILAMGAGAEREGAFAIFGLPIERRATMFADVLAIVAPLLRDGQVDYSGTFYNAHAATLGLRGPRPHGPPIWVAGKGPRMLELAARWGDGFNLNMDCPPDPAPVIAAYARLDEACRAVGRDPASIRRSAYSSVTFADPDVALPPAATKHLHGTPEAVAAQLHALHTQAGVQHMTCFPRIFGGSPAGGGLPRLTPAALDRFAAVIAALRQLEAA
jgi:alkanesulfonate monooxygenase SsuD/methylene tetrahydromethanopterin reductase-like flavin-dependent oxidoreductase (luciferase family)